MIRRSGNDNATIQRRLSDDSDVISRQSSGEKAAIAVLDSIRSLRGFANRRRGLAQLMRNDLDLLFMTVGRELGGAIYRDENRRAVAKIQADIVRCEAEARAADAEAEKLIQMLPEDGVLYPYYALAMTWEEIAYQKDIYLRTVYKLRKKELENFEKELEKRERI